MLEFSPQRRDLLLFLITNMAAVTSRLNQQYSSMCPSSSFFRNKRNEKREWDCMSLSLRDEDWLFKIKGSFSNHKSNGSETSLKNGNSRFLKLHSSYSILFNLSNVGKFFGSWFWRTVFKFRKRTLFSCVHVLLKTWNLEVSRCIRETTAKMNKKAVVHAPAKLLLC